MNLKMPVSIEEAQTNSQSRPSYQANGRVRIEVPASGNGFLRERRKTDPTEAPEVLYLQLLSRVVKQMQDLQGVKQNQEAGPLMGTGGCANSPVSVQGLLEAANANAGDSYTALGP